MRVKHLQIKLYRHLQDVGFDFTYPKGHPHAGKALNKICIIGQSATGKTSVLELIKDSISRLARIEIIDGQYFFHGYNLNFEGEIEFELENSQVKMTNENVTKGDREVRHYPGNSISGAVGNLVSEKEIKLLYLSADIISSEAVKFFNQNPLNILNDISSEKNSSAQKKHNDAGYIYEFTQEVSLEVWVSLSYKVLDYRKRFTQLASELISKGIIGDPARLSQSYEKWAEANPNPLLSFAKYFNPVLQKLNLEVDLVSTEYLVPIQSKSNNNIIPVTSLSTGTKGLLLSMFPLHSIDTTDSMILLDEPERSLFPDMQIDLLSHYQTLAPDAQIIVATHSPFIAASFEPEERFILYFDENGKVAVRKGESPIGDDPNDILRNDFHVDYYNDFGKRAYQQYLDLKSKAAREIEPTKKKALIIELSELGDKYNF